VTVAFARLSPFDSLEFEGGIDFKGSFLIDSGQFFPV
jgi:hypothetical protein